MNAFRYAFPGVEEKKFEKACALAVKKVKPQKVERQQIKSKAAYNTVALDHVPYVVQSVADADQEVIAWKIRGQQVMCSRNLRAPVAVEYVTVEENRRWHKEMIEAIREATKD